MKINIFLFLFYYFYNIFVAIETSKLKILTYFLFRVTVKNVKYILCKVKNKEKRTP